MSHCTIVDAGPLVAYFSATDTYHDWTFEQFVRLPQPLLTCEAALSEACYLLVRDGHNPTIVLHAVARGALRLEFSLAEELEAVRNLMTRYRDAGVSLADACLVRMSEIHSRCELLTLDRDFLVYRRNGRQTIPLIAPFA